MKLISNSIKDGEPIPGEFAFATIPASLREIGAGGHSNGITLKGKPGPEAPQGARHGINDYAKWFANDPDMHGDYYGYDGPCPPWNDSLPHHYVFTLYALDVAHIDVQDLSGESVQRAISSHVLRRQV